MKKFAILSFLIMIIFCNTNLYSQYNNVDNSVLKSIVKAPPNFSPQGTQSTVQTINGFDNFLLGSDFGEPYIAVNPTDPKNMVCAYNMNSFYYTLNGHDWTRGYPVFSGYSTLGDPVMAYDSLGILYYVQLYQNGSTYGVVVGKSIDKGVSWSSYTSAGSFNGGLCDKEWVACDQTGGPNANNIYIGWRQFGSSGMRFVRSTNGGASYSSPLTLSGDQGAYVSVGPNGTIPGGYVYFAAISGSSIAFYRSGDGGASFSSMGYAATGITGPGTVYAGRYTVKAIHARTDFFPRMAADNSYTSTRGNVYVVYAANPPGPDLADIFMVKSTNNGTSWSAPVKINDDVSTCDQWMPAITVDKKTGKVYIFWYDSRNDPANVMTELYGTVSTDGGATFAPNSKISTANFNPNTMAQSQGSGEAYYMGDYQGNGATNNTSINVWADDRIGSPQAMQSFVGYNPDFAMTTNPSTRSLVNNDSTTVAIIVPGIKGIYNDKVKFSAVLDTLPSSGSIQFSFVNGRDSLTTFPDSVYLKIKTVGTVTSRLYRVIVTGTGTGGTPVHKRTINLLVNSSFVNVQSNRNGICNFLVNGVSYNINTQFVFPNGSTFTVAAVTPQVAGGNQFVFQNWSDNGAATHTVTVNGPLNLTVNYKIQYLLLINSAVPNTFGGGQFYDSAVTFNFGVNSKLYLYNWQLYRYRGFDGFGNGAYTSPDSTGNDTNIVMTGGIINPIVEVPRWELLSYVQNISSGIPTEYKLHQNYPNPFNPSTTIDFDIIKTGNVKITIYDALGREIKSLVNEVMQPGSYKTVFNAEGISSGIYFYRISTNDFTDIKKLVLMK